MPYSDYVKASKIGKKDYQSKVLKGQLPTLEVLDDILHSTRDYHEVSLGLVNIPLDQIVGTKLPAEAIPSPVILCLFLTCIQNLHPNG